VTPPVKISHRHQVVGAFWATLTTLSESITVSPAVYWIKGNTMLSLGPMLLWLLSILKIAPVEGMGR
jgi:hypothetical protein